MPGPGQNGSELSMAKFPFIRHKVFPAPLMDGNLVDWAL